MLIKRYLIFIIIIFKSFYILFNIGVSIKKIYDRWDNFWLNLFYRYTCLKTIGPDLLVIFWSN